MLGERNTFSVFWDDDAGWLLLGEIMCVPADCYRLLSVAFDGLCAYAFVNALWRVFLPLLAFFLSVLLIRLEWLFAFLSESSV
jgi:hypothetical protein